MRRDACHPALRRACACVFFVSASVHAQESGSAVAAAASAGPARIEVTDETGRKVSVHQPVRRIVSLAPSLTETVFALGAQDRLVGDTDYCDYPPEAVAKAKVGGAINPNLEQVVALRPDIVLVTKSLNRRETVVALEQLGVAAYATDPHTVEEMIASTAKLAEVIGAQDAGVALETDLRARLAELKRRVGALSPKRALFVVWAEPLISVGRDTFIADALRWAGAESIVRSSQSWPQVSLEEAVRLQPDVLVFASSHSETVARDLSALAQLPGWRNLEAARNRRFAVISDAVNRPAPRLISAIEQLARQLHPQVFAPPAGQRNHAPAPSVIPRAGDPAKRDRPEGPQPLRLGLHPQECASCAR